MGLRQGRRGSAAGIRGWERVLDGAFVEQMWQNLKDEEVDPRDDVEVW